MLAKLLQLLFQCLLLTSMANAFSPALISIRYTTVTRLNLTPRHDAQLCAAGEVYLESPPRRRHNTLSMRHRLEKFLEAASPASSSNALGVPVTSSRFTLSKEELFPAIGIRWVKVGGETHLLSLQTQGQNIRLRPKDDEIVGWWNEICWITP